jgi:hypothetical protein
VYFCLTNVMNLMYIQSMVEIVLPPKHNTVSKGLFRNRSQNVLQLFCDRFLKRPFADIFQKLYERCQPCVVKDGDYFEGQQI